MSLWTPSAISTALWLDASDSSTLFDAVSGGSTPANNGAIARWEDKSGSGRHVTQATPANRPLRSVGSENGLDVATFDGSNDSLSNSSAALLRSLSGYSVFIVAKSTAATALEQTLFQVQTSGANSRFVASKLAITGFARMGGRRLASESFSSVDGTVHINQLSVWSTVVNHSITTITGLINGTQYGQNTSFQSAGITENNAGELFIGSNLVGAANWPGQICEIVVASTAYAVTDRQLVEGYLAWKWGTQASLPSDHPYKPGAPTTGAQRRVINDGLFNRGLFGGSLVR